MVRIVKFVVYVVKTLDFNNIFWKDDRCGDMKIRNNDVVAQITHEVLITRTCLPQAGPITCKAPNNARSA